MTYSFHVSLLFDLSIKLLSELMIFSSMLINFRFIVDFNLHKHEKFQFSIFDLQHSHLCSYWVEWRLVLIIWLCFITCQSIWYIICFNKLLLLVSSYVAFWLCMSFHLRLWLELLFAHMWTSALIFANFAWLATFAKSASSARFANSLSFALHWFSF